MRPGEEWDPLENAVVRCLGWGTQDIMIKIQKPRVGTPGKLSYPTSSELSTAGLFLAGLATVMGTAVLEFGVPSPLPREFKPSYFLRLLSSHCPLEEGCTMAFLVTRAQVPDIVTGSSPPLSGHQNPNFVQNNRVPRPRR